MSFRLVKINIISANCCVSVDKQVFSFLETLQIDMLAQIGLSAGPFDPSEEIKDAIDKSNDSQMRFSLVKINITTVCFHFTVDK